MNNATPRLDIIIPVYNEGDNIVPTLRALARGVKTPNRILICYDREDDDTLPAIKNNRESFDKLAIEFVRNRGRGAHGAVLTGFCGQHRSVRSRIPGGRRLQRRHHRCDGRGSHKGCDIVCASRFMAGGSMVGCPWLKAVLVRAASFTLYHVARLPTHDASSGFRLFSRRVLDEIEIESERGFCYSIELLVKCHRLHWRIGEVPAQWFERPTAPAASR